MNRLSLTPSNIERTKKFVAEHLADLRAGNEWTDPSTPKGQIYQLRKTSPTEASRRVKALSIAENDPEIETSFHNLITVDEIISNIDRYFPFVKMDLNNPSLSILSGSGWFPLVGKSGYEITDMPSTEIINNVRVVNPEINFDSAKRQVGMIGSRKMSETFEGKTEAVNFWPPTTPGFGSGGFVGIQIPIKDTLAKSGKPVDISAVELKVLNHEIVISVDGDPVDISFLFQRGQTDEDYIALARIEGLLTEAETNYNRAVARISATLDGKEKER